MPYRGVRPVNPAARRYRPVGYQQPYVPQTISPPVPVYAYKGVFPRFFAKVLDGFILGIPVGILMLLVSLATGYFTNADGFLAPLLLSLLLVVTFIVSIALEGGGGTPGKRILGMRIVDSDGSKPGFGKALVRNLLGIIDFIPVAYILGVVLVASSPTKQRLGDRIAGTYVIGRE
jgi:uncharacterized RDD family membrane protein YckC